MGKLAEACLYYDEIIAQWEEEEDENDVEDLTARVEIHLLYSDVLFDLGSFEDDEEEDGVDDDFVAARLSIIHPGSNKGALFHSKKGLELLKKILSVKDGSNNSTPGDTTAETNAR